MLIVVACASRSPAPEPPPAPPAAVGCIGDSITQVGGYPERLGELLAPEYIVTNEGRSGDETGQILGRYRSTVSARGHDWLVVLGGWNDINHDLQLATIQGNLLSLYEEAAADGSRVVAVTVLPGATFAYRQLVRADLNAFILDTCASRPDLAACVDAATVMDDGSGELLPEYTYDGVHLTTTGAHVLAEQVHAVFP